MNPVRFAGYAFSVAAIQLWHYFEKAAPDDTTNGCGRLLKKDILAKTGPRLSNGQQLKICRHSALDWNKNLGI